MITDPYVLKAAKIFKCTPEQVTEEQRRFAKQVAYSEQYRVVQPLKTLLSKVK